MSEPAKPTEFHHTSWANKFQRSARGCWIAVCETTGGRFSSWWVHFSGMIAAITCGVVLRISNVEWCIVIFAIGIVVICELLNTAIEHLSRSITTEHDPNIRNALDVASGAVLCASVLALIVGTLVFSRFL